MLEIGWSFEFGSDARMYAIVCYEPFGGRLPEERSVGNLRNRRT